MTAKYHINLGRGIRAARAQRGMKQVQLAEVLGIEQSYISRLEGGTKTPSFRFLLRICRALHMRPSQLLKLAEIDTAEACMVNPPQ